MVFVTGATGLVGSHLLYFLVAAGKEVYALRRKDSPVELCRSVFLQYTDNCALWECVHWVGGDVLQPETLEAYIRDADEVYHCAAVVSFQGADKELLLQINTTGSENVASLCLSHQTRLCYVSSIAALGDAVREGDVVDEDTPEISGMPHSIYSGSKSAAEKIVWDYIGRGLSAVIVNPSIILGAGMWGRSSTKLFLTAAKGIGVYTGGVCGYVDVRDVCELMVRLTDDRSVEGERFLLNGGNYSYQALFTAIAGAMGNKPPLFSMPPFLTEVAWRVLAVAGMLTGKEPAFTRETARSAQKKSYYSNNKILRQLPDFRFRTLEETVGHMAGRLKRETSK